MKKNPLRVVWQNMKERCYSTKYINFKKYGGRGITVCEEWLNPQTFIKWAIENGYQKGLQIDRINNDGNYEPSNCRFVTNKDNLNNRSNTIRITINGETLTLPEWCERIGLPYNTVHTRIKRGWNPITAVTTNKATHVNSKSKPIVCINTGRKYDSLTIAAKELNLQTANVSKVLRKERKSTGGYMFELAV